MSLDPALCLAGFEAKPLAIIRLGIIGFGDRARAYNARARKGSRTIETIVFVLPASPEWAEAKLASRQFLGMTLCPSQVTAIFPVPDALTDEGCFLIETSCGTYPVDDLFLNSGGAAIWEVTPPQ